MTIVPDTKDWTWVLQHPCPDCGLDTQSFAREAVAGMVRANAPAWHQVLTQPGDHGTAPHRADGRPWSTAAMSGTSCASMTGGWK